MLYEQTIKGQTSTEHPYLPFSPDVRHQRLCSYGYSLDHTDVQSPKTFGYDIDNTNTKSYHNNIIQNSDLNYNPYRCSKIKLQKYNSFSNKDKICKNNNNNFNTKKNINNDDDIFYINDSNLSKEGYQHERCFSQVLTSSNNEIGNSINNNTNINTVKNHTRNRITYEIRNYNENSKNNNSLHYNSICCDCLEALNNNIYNNENYFCLYTKMKEELIKERERNKSLKQRMEEEKNSFLNKIQLLNGQVDSVMGLVNYLKCNNIIYNNEKMEDLFEELQKTKEDNNNKNKLINEFKQEKMISDLKINDLNEKIRNTKTRKRNEKRENDNENEYLKRKLNKCNSDLKEMTTKKNDAVNNYNKLLKEHKELLKDYNQLLENHNMVSKKSSGPYKIERKKSGGDSNKNKTIVTNKIDNNTKKLKNELEKMKKDYDEINKYENDRKKIFNDLKNINKNNNQQKNLLDKIKSLENENKTLKNLKKQNDDLIKENEKLKNEIKTNVFRDNNNSKKNEIMEDEIVVVKKEYIFTNNNDKEAKSSGKRSFKRNGLKEENKEFTEMNENEISQIKKLGCIINDLNNMLVIYEDIIFKGKKKPSNDKELSIFLLVYYLNKKSLKMKLHFIKQLLINRAVSEAIDGVN